MSWPSGVRQRGDGVNLIVFVPRLGTGWQTILPETRDGWCDWEGDLAVVRTGRVRKKRRTYEEERMGLLWKQCRACDAMRTRLNGRMGESLRERGRRCLTREPVMGWAFGGTSLGGFWVIRTRDVPRCTKDAGMCAEDRWRGVAGGSSGRGWLKTGGERVRRKDVAKGRVGGGNVCGGRCGGGRGRRATKGLYVE